MWAHSGQAAPSQCWNSLSRAEPSGSLWLPLVFALAVVVNLKHQVAVILTQATKSDNKENKSMSKSMVLITHMWYDTPEL